MLDLWCPQPRRGIIEMKALSSCINTKPLEKSPMANGRDNDAQSGNGDAVTATATADQRRGGLWVRVYVRDTMTT